MPEDRNERLLNDGSGKLSAQAPVGTLERGLAVLAALEGGVEGMTLTQLASNTGLPKPTTSRLLGTLSEYGFVEKDGKRFRVGYRCFRLGNLYTFDEYLQRRALPIMEDLMQEVREVVQLGVLRDRQVLYLERVEPQRSIAVVLSRPGSVRPAHCTALGKAMLSRLADEELEEYLEQADLEAMTPTTIISRESLREALEATRERGYAVDDGEADEDVGCVAAPILDDRSRAVAAISVSAPRFRMSGDSRDRAANLVRRAATELSGG